MMRHQLRWLLGVSLGIVLVVAPFGYYRWQYAREKRLREVTPGRFYRSGQMTAEGFRDAIQRLGIRTVINAQDEYPDPDVAVDYWGRETIKETDICREAGVEYIHLAPELISKRRIPRERPASIDRYLAILDDERSYPILLHCKAGLHRTGVLTAVYRMEYQGWTAGEALREMKVNGFGDSACTSANDYVIQYVLAYRPGIRESIALR